MCAHTYMILLYNMYAKTFNLKLWKCWTCRYFHVECMVKAEKRPKSHTTKNVISAKNWTAAKEELNNRNIIRAKTRIKKSVPIHYIQHRQCLLILRMTHGETMGSPNVNFGWLSTLSCALPHSTSTQIRSNVRKSLYEFFRLETTLTT